MLEYVTSKEIQFVESMEPAVGYQVLDPRFVVVDPMTAHLSATLVGPEGTRVIGRAWISDEEGGIAESEIAEVEAGQTVQLQVSIPKPKGVKGRLIACIRVEYPLFDTKHVVHAYLE